MIRILNILENEKKRRQYCKCDRNKKKSHHLREAVLCLGLWQCQQLCHPGQADPGVVLCHDTDIMLHYSSQQILPPKFIEKVKKLKYKNFEWDKKAK